MITITLTHEEAYTLKNLVRAQRTSSDRYVSHYKLGAAEKRKYTKVRDNAARLEKKFEVFGI